MLLSIYGTDGWLSKV